MDRKLGVSTFFWNAENWNIWCQKVIKSSNFQMLGNFSCFPTQILPHSNAFWCVTHACIRVTWPSPSVWNVNLKFELEKVKHIFWWCQAENGQNNDPWRFSISKWCFFSVLSKKHGGFNQNWYYQYRSGKSLSLSGDINTLNMSYRRLIHFYNLQVTI